MTDEPVTRVVSIVGLEERWANRRLFARLDAVSLAELLQLNGQRTDRSVFRVTSGTLSGHLFFEAGALHEARFGDVTGLEAVARMLGLETGAFEACDAPWPTVGNVQLPAPTALLRATRLRERWVVRTVDSLLLQPAVAGGPLPESELESSTLAFYEQARKLGDALGLTRLAAARLADDLWLFLLYHDSRPERLSAVLGSRPRADRGTEEREGVGTAAARRPTRSLAELSDKDGILAAFGSGPHGASLASELPPRLRVDDLARVLALGEQLLGCSREIGFGATDGELRFAGRRVVITRSGDGLVGVVAVSSVAVSWVRELVARLTHRMAAGPAATSSSSHDAWPRR